MLSSKVSSRMLSRMAQVEGFHHEETLTGFKWLGNRSLKLVEQGYIVPYAFEEAIGYMFSDIVRDKDGVAAAVVFLCLAREAYSQGGTISGFLDTLYQRYFLPRTN
jgi:phosphoglucomutase